MTREFLYCGELVSEGGLAPVAKLLTDCSWRIELQHSGYDGTSYLRMRRPQIRRAVVARMLKLNTPRAVGEHLCYRRKPAFGNQLAAVKKLPCHGLVEAA